MIIDTDELIDREGGLISLLVGYRALLASPDTTPEIKAELSEGIAKNEKELALVEVALASLTALADNGYPDHLLEETSPAVIAALEKLVEDINLVPKDFKTPVLVADSGIIGLAAGETQPAKKAKKAN